MQHEHFFNASCFQVPGAHGSFWTTPKSKNHVKWDPFFKYIIRYLYWLPLKWRKMIQKKYLHPNGQQQQQQHLETPQFYYSFTHFCWWELVATLKKKAGGNGLRNFCVEGAFQGGFWPGPFHFMKVHSDSEAGLGLATFQLNYDPQSNIPIWTYTTIIQKTHPKREVSTARGVSTKKISDLQKLWGVRRFFLALRWKSPMWFCILKHLHC